MEPNSVSHDPLLADVSFNRHSLNDGSHNSPFNNGQIDVGYDNIKVRLVQGINEEDFQTVLGKSLKATTGIDPDAPPEEIPWEEMLKGGLQASLESQVIAFEVSGVSRACTHQLVRTRKAGFHQQSQRATFMGEQPDVRIPASLQANPRARDAFVRAVLMARESYRISCEEDISYQDARYVLNEGTETYILCEYPLREFIATFAYRGCSMFLWETVYSFREMRKLLLEAHPWLKPYVKISCQDRPCPDCEGEGRIWMPSFDVMAAPDEDQSGGYWNVCETCGGFGMIGSRCTFQGWEKVEGQCPFPQAKEELRVYKPDPKLRIGS